VIHRTLAYQAEPNAQVELNVGGGNRCRKTLRKQEAELSCLLLFTLSHNSSCAPIYVLGFLICAQIL
jgi:hypothetical protein